MNEDTDRRQVLEKTEKAACAIENWMKAYPENFFPEIEKEEWGKFHSVLDEAGLSLGRVSASNMRHVLNGLREYLEPILEMVKEMEGME